MDEDQGALPAKEDFSGWYNELLWRAEIMDVRYPVKGLYVWYPFGFALRKNVYGVLRALLDVDHEEALFPLLIPETELAKEGEHIKGFEDEVYWVTHGGVVPARGETRAPPNERVCHLPDVPPLGTLPCRPPAPGLPDCEHVPVRDEAYPAADPAPGDHVV
jgi:hypothetical protein